MMGEFFLSDIFLSILQISVSTGLIVIVLLLLTPFLNKRYAVKWKYLIWIFLAMRLLVPFSQTNGQFVIDWVSRLNAWSKSEPEESNIDSAADGQTPYRRIVVEIPTQMTTPLNVPAEKIKAGITPLDITALIWFMGSLIFISIHLISYFHYKRQVIKKGRTIEEACILSQMDQFKCEFNIRRTVCVMEYREAKSPMIIGFIKPVLVLPKEQYCCEELYFILKHELVHLKRVDVYLKLLFVTANAIHWFNPIIWIMQKEAVIDMELSCDERVTKGTSYAFRKAYTETLLAMLHKQCVRKNVLSTQFYGGAKIMKKRFQNILIKTRKRNGIFILLCAVVLTVSVGTLVGCSITKEDTEIIELEPIENEDAAEADMKNVPEQAEQKAALTEPIAADTITLTFSKEGEQEEKQASLAVGNGYSLYLPDDEQWHLSAPDLWTTDINEQVTLWVTHFEGESMDSVRQKLWGDGYDKESNLKWLKQEGDMIYHAEQKVFENDIWGIFYSYPVDCEEGWGGEFPVIAATFALSDEGENTMGTGDYLQVEDSQEIRAIVDTFAKAYFDDSIDVMQQFLSSTYEGEIDTYASTGTVSDFTVKGLSDNDGKYNVSMEFRDSSYEDMFLYLTVILVREEDGWKIQFYGVEG